ncbi:MAG: glycosyltransferase family 39 protein [Chloroflexi bacterium]|nr:glycosyltransferase family 39 protein [Chloroflexota bacterium]
MSAATERLLPAKGGDRCWHPAQILMVVLVGVSFFFRVLWLDQPPGSLIFDEKYYVSAARTILGLPQSSDAPYAHSPVGKDPNAEHPPLAKLIMAFDMRELGDNAWGWRWGSVVAGTLLIPLLYSIGRRVRLGPWAALLAAFLMSFDNLVFVTSRIGILDIFMLLGMLAGIALFLRGHPILSGFAFAFGILCKEFGALGPVIVGVYVLALLGYQRPGWKRAFFQLRDLAVMGGVTIAVLLIGLWQLDLHWGTYKNPIAHLEYIWKYGTGLTNHAGPTGIESWPWEWLINEVQIPYLKVTVTVCSTTLPGNKPCPPAEIVRQYDSILFRGAMNPFLIALLPMSYAYALARLSSSERRNALLAIVWFAVCYLPFLPATVIDHRISYIYYMLPIIPALSLATAELFSSERMPRSVTAGLVVAILFGFAGYFPFAGFKL